MERCQRFLLQVSPWLPVDPARLEKLMEWARICFNGAKEREGGQWEDGTTIPTVMEKPVKNLSKMFDSTLRDAASIQSTCTELDVWLKLVDRSGLPGKLEAWLYQHGILPRILWPLLIYEMPISTVETLERKVSSHLGKWLGLPKSLSSTALYGNSNKL